MASTSNGWTVISTKVESDELIADSETKTKSINDYYEETGDLERKCRLCATIVKIAKTTKWNLKQHFKKRHPIEWASEFEPFLRTVQAKSTRESKVDSVSDMAFDNVNYFGDEAADTDEQQSSTKRMKWDETHDAGETATLNNNHNSLAMDDCAIFGNYIATEMRALVSDQSRRELKLLMQKALLEVFSKDLERNGMN